MLHFQGISSYFYGFFSSITNSNSVPNKLQQAYASFTGEFSAHLNLRFHTLYQRSCAKGYIATQHPLWNIELQALDVKMTRVWEDATKLYDEIPSLVNPQEKIAALSSMLYLEKLAFQLKEKCRKLCLILDSPLHQTTLKYYKEKVKQCEAFAGQDLDESCFIALYQEVENCYDDIEEDLKKEDAYVQEEITLLYSEILAFIEYATRILGKDNIKSNPQSLLSAKSIVITDKESQLSEDKKRELTNTHLANLQSVALPTENYFRVGQRLPTRRYPEISNEFLFLEKIARALYQVEDLVKRLFEQVCNGDIDFDAVLQQATAYTNTVHSLELLINDQALACTKKPLSNQIHAYWYYVAGLRAQSRSVQATIAELSDGQFISYARAARELKVYIETKHSANQIKAAWRLYATMLAVQQMPQPSDAHVRVYKVINDTYANEVHFRIELAENETNICAQVFNRTFCWHANEQELESFLVKGLLNTLYFSNEPCDPAFEAFIFRLERDPNYRDNFHKCLAKFLPLQSLYKDFLVKSQRLIYDGSLRKMTDVLITLLATQQETILQPTDSRIALFNRFIRFHKAVQVLRELTAQFAHDNTAGGYARLTWFKSHLNEFSQRWKKAREIAEPFKEHPLYINLYTSQFCSDPEVRKATDKAIVEALSSTNFDINSVTDILKVLLYRWALERFLAEPKGKNALVQLANKLADIMLDDHPAVELHIIATLFSSYVSSHKWTELWRNQYDTGFMELALQKYYHKVKDPKSTDCKNGFKMRVDEWQVLDSVLSCYSEFRKIIDEHGCLIVDSVPYKEARDRYNRANSFLVRCNPDNKAENLQIASQLCLEMKEFLYNGRISYYKNFI